MSQIIDKRARARLFRTRLIQAMDTAQCSRAELARRIGVDRSTISQLLTPDETRLANAHLVALMAQGLGVSSDWLLGLSDARESVGEVLATALAMPRAERALVDEQILAWHAEAEGYKIRHVPATLPDMLKTSALLRWDMAPGEQMGAALDSDVQIDATILAARDKLSWMRQTENDYEIALPLHELTALASGTGYYKGLAAAARLEQLQWMGQLIDQLYPSLRVFPFDMRRAYSAPITIYGPRVGVVYLGRNYLAFRDRERVQGMIRHFDWLVRESHIPPRAVPDYLRALEPLVAKA